MSLPPIAPREPGGALVLAPDAVAFLQHELRCLREVLEREQGRRIDQAGAAETTQETANRQDFVDQLSAAVGIKADPVRQSPMPDTTRAVDHGAVMSRINRLCDWLDGNA